MDDPSFLICHACQGDPRAAERCATCRGAGVSLASSEGYLVWQEPLDEFVFAFRAFKRQANALLHVAFILGILACFASLILPLAWRGEWMQLQRWDFWLSGTWNVSLWWLGWFAVCFLIFRIRVYTDQTQRLPNWGKTVKEQRAVPTVYPDPNAATNVAPFFDAEAWLLLEHAYRLAVRTGRSEVLPVHLFSAALTSESGGLFLTRLGSDFETLKQGLVEVMRRGQAGSPTMLSLDTKHVLLSAYLNAYQARRKHVGVMEIFLAAFDREALIQEALDAAGVPPRQVRSVAEWIRMQQRLREQHERFVSLASLKPKAAMNRTMTARHTAVLERFGEDLTSLARDGYLPPLVGREKEMDELWRLFASGRRAIALVGETGVGKTAMIEEVARRMVEEDVPSELFDHRLVSVRMPELISAGDPAEVSQRLLTLLREAAVSGNVVLVMEGVEALAGFGSGGPLDLAEMLANELQRYALPVIATTTPRAWTEYLERRSLGTQLAKLNVAEMTPEEALPVLMARSSGLEFQNKVFFSYAALEKAVTLAGRYLHEAQLPESALEIAREAAVVARQAHGEYGFVSAEDVARVIHEKTNIPVEAVTQDESSKLLALEERLHQRVIGQDEAVKAVAQAIRRARAEVREGKRPIANFLFLGPTGVGKTELAKALAAEYFGSEQAMVRLDMSEYQDQASIQRVIGTSGDQRGGLLTEAVRKTPFAIVLLDELEKAHPDILTLFLQVMDDGRLTDGVGRTIDFTNVVLIATSNAGTTFIQEQVKNATPLEQIRTTLLERELKGTFRPEFLNRFDGVIVFKPLVLDDVTQIAWLMINGIAAHLEKDKGISFRAEDEAVEELARLGFDPLFGARPLRRMIQDRVENALADLLLRKAVQRRDTLVLQANGTLRVEKAKLSV